MKNFLYLIQCEEELPGHLNGLRGPESDIIFLSWGKPAKEGIFYPNSTWTQGRNRLYQEALRLQKNYLYYIFMDEDVYLRTTKYFKVSWNSLWHLWVSSANPWRIFEDYLRRYRPAVGVPFYKWHKKQEKEIDAIFTFDAIIIAVHKEALNVLLPYYDGHDMESWWYAQVYFNHIAALLYPSHVLQFNALMAENTSQRDPQFEEKKIYPHDNNWAMANDFIKSTIIDEKLKMHFQNHPQSASLSNGKVKMKGETYTYSKEKLSRLFNLNTPFWKRKFKIYVQCQ